jgi:hypothetical protein
MGEMRNIKLQEDNVNKRDILQDTDVDRKQILRKEYQDMKWKRLDQNRGRQRIPRNATIYP